MNSLFARLLIIFSTALILFLIILVCIFYFGFQESISEWQLNKEQEYLVYAESILQGVEIDIPADIPFFVYDSNRKIIFTNRGQRKHDSNQGTTVPVYSGNTITGYYYAGYMNFVNDNTNIQFIDSLRDVIIIAVVISFLIALMFSLVFSRRLSRQAKSVSKNLKRISSGYYDISVAEKGVKEISQIANSANLLSKQLKKEHNLRIQWAEDLAHDLRTPLSALIAQF